MMGRLLPALLSSVPIKIRGIKGAMTAREALIRDCP